MKIQGKISILIDRDKTTIEIHDDNAAVSFCKVTLTPEQLSAALSRLSRVECEVSVDNLDLVGKTHENKYFEFEMPENIKRDYMGKNKELAAYAQSILADGWISDGYFESQNSFFEKDGKQWARVTIRKWS